MSTVMQKSPTVFEVPAEVTRIRQVFIDVTPTCLEITK